MNAKDREFWLFVFFLSFLFHLLLLCVCLQRVGLLVLMHAYRRAQTAADVCVGVSSLHLRIWGTELRWSVLCTLFHY